MEITFTLALPRDELSVPVVRRILTSSLQTLGVLDEVIGDIEVALSEACSNVLQHAGDGDYEVCCEIDGEVCLIEVIDRGRGFDATGKGLTPAPPTAEHGRGIALMRALVDTVRFDKGTADGTVVHLEKHLEWREGAALTTLDHTPAGDSARSPEGAAEPR